MTEEEKFKQLYQIVKTYYGQHTVRFFAGHKLYFEKHGGLDEFLNMDKTKQGQLLWDNENAGHDLVRKQLENVFPRDTEKYLRAQVAKYEEET